MKKEKCPPHEIERVLVLSTGHISEADSKLLDAGTIPCTRYEYGYLIYVGERKDLQEAREQLIPTGISAALYYLLLLTVDKKCTWLKLDRDGPVRTDLPLFNW
jgi:hypothetical protein